MATARIGKAAFRKTNQVLESQSATITRKQVPQKVVNSIQRSIGFVKGRVSKGSVLKRLLAAQYIQFNLIEYIEQSSYCTGTTGTVSARRCLG